MAAGAATGVVATRATTGNSGSAANSPGAKSGGNVIARVTATRGDGTVHANGNWLPAEGFPKGWQVAVGDDVAVLPALQGSGMSAHPVVHWEHILDAPANLAIGSTIGGNAGPLITPATVLTPVLTAGLRHGDSQTRPLKVAIADRSAGGTQRAFSVRET